MNQDLRNQYLQEAEERTEHHRIHTMLKNHECQSGIVAISFIAFWMAWGIAVIIFLWPYLMTVQHFISGIVN